MQFDIVAVNNELLVGIEYCPGVSLLGYKLK